jgi:uncharacterized protein (TIGR02452 family)
MLSHGTAGSGVTKLVLGSMGCGAYGCPPRPVAREMKKALEREEFEGWFGEVVFAVYAAGKVGEESGSFQGNFWECVEDLVSQRKTL